MLDPATLSQAWRDALHLAALRPLSPAERRTEKLVPVPPRVSGAAISRAGTGKCGVVHPRLDKSHVCFSQGAMASERSAVASRARRLHPEDPWCWRRSSTVVRSHYVLTLPQGERVCMLVTDLGSGLHITILCARHLQARMRQALATLAQACAHASIALNVASYAEEK